MEGDQEGHVTWKWNKGNKKGIKWKGMSVNLRMMGSRSRKVIEAAGG